MRSITLCIFILLFFSKIHAQQEASNWYFGQNAGITFNDDGTVTSVNDGQLTTLEGCASISDNDGNLLLYTDGTLVYNKHHTLMPNGFGLLGDSSSSQSAIIVPKPDDPNIYYIFTVGSNQSLTGLKYSIVDMTLDGGNGDVVQKNINLLNQCSEKISAVLQSCETGKVWVVTLSNPTGNSASSMNTFHVFGVDENGVSSTAITSSFGNLNVNDLRGYLKFSPDGTKMAAANGQDGLYIFDFDKATGVVSNSLKLLINGNNNTPYGIEFSPSSELLYASSSNDLFGEGDQNPNNHHSKLVQFDLTATNINDSQVLLDQQNLYRSALQLGPNGKIYRTMSATYELGLPFLSVINDPNIAGINCDYENNAINLGSNLATQGLPPFITSFFTEKVDIIGNQEVTSTYLPLCEGSSFTLTAPQLENAIYTWRFNGDIIPETSYNLVINQAGFYNVIIEFIDGDCDYLEGEALIEYFPNPISHEVEDILECDDNNDGIIQFDFSTLGDQALNGQDPEVYSVHFFQSSEDAQNKENEIGSPFINSTNPQEIFVRVDLTGSPNCYDLSSFFITVFDTPIIPELQNIVFCDEGLNDGNQTNGQAEIDLSSLIDLIYNGQDPDLFSITFYESENDAINNENSLPLNYYNSTPFLQDIYVKVKNVNNEDCFDIDFFTVQINPTPEAFDTTLLQCDQDFSPDGITLFNLNEANSLVSNTPDQVSIAYFESFEEAQDNLQPLDYNYLNTTNPQIIFARVFDPSTGCYSISQVSLEVSTTQISDYEVPGVCDEPNSEDGINTFDLNEVALQIQNNNNISFPISFYSSYDDALLEENALEASYTNSIPYFQVIYARAENNNACYGIAEVTLRVHELPNLQSDVEVFYCLNDSPESITLNAGIFDGSTNNTFEWSTGETTPDIQVNTVGAYTVTATNVWGCSKSRTIVVSPSNIATIEAIHVTDASENNTISIVVSGEGTYEFALFNQNGLFADFQPQTTFQNVPPGIYTVAVRDVKNDCGLVEDMVSVIGFPKYFTPNNDGQNDFWQIIGVTQFTQPNTEILIFNRYGKLITKIDPLGMGWDGTLNGEPLPTDDYWFFITLQDGRIFKSHFTLKR
ncbi:T9SS type B sorting domain-containing protein [Mangrovimonas sp. ST2L15]|uniref:T9SS type B sorting domain-containing protein n=1 Tax=Mangrovimonas sp. ST2L15 TaxID=1645916 RepID=UPI0006B55082|nr:T9SS type B sorting domain-containing protein [Mangrovimonas sp. ST2L15]